MDSISFERLKTIVKENIPRLMVNGHILGDGVASALIAHVRMCLDGHQMRTGWFARKAVDSACGFVDLCDVRSVADILSVVPKGYDRRIPSWLYEGYEAYMDDDDWVLCRKSGRS